MLKLLIRNVTFFLLIYVLTSFNSNLFSQTIEPEQKKNYFGIGLAFPFFRTFTIDYERVLNKNQFIRLSLSTQVPSNRQSYDTKQGMLFLVTINKQQVFTSNSVFLGYGYFIIPQVGLYLAGELSYRYNYFENKYHYTCVGTDMDSKVSLESEYHNDYGVQSRIGIKLILKKLKRMNFFIDFNGGFGLYLSNQEILLIAESKGTCSNKDIHYFSEPKVTNTKTVVPLIMLNANIGINF